MVNKKNKIVGSVQLVCTVLTMEYPYFVFRILYFTVYGYLPVYNVTYGRISTASVKSNNQLKFYLKIGNEVCRCEQYRINEIEKIAKYNEKNK